MGLPFSVSGSRNTGTNSQIGERRNYYRDLAIKIIPAKLPSGDWMAASSESNMIERIINGRGLATSTTGPAGWMLYRRGQRINQPPVDETGVGAQMEIRSHTSGAGSERSLFVCSLACLKPLNQRLQGQVVEFDILARTANWAKQSTHSLSFHVFPYPVQNLSLVYAKHQQGQTTCSASG